MQLPMYMYIKAWTVVKPERGVGGGGWEGRQGVGMLTIFSQLYSEYIHVVTVKTICL